MVQKLKAGDKVRVIIAWKNTGSESHKFVLGCSIRPPSGHSDYDLPLEKDTTAAGKTDDNKFDWWKVPSNAPKGTYAIIGAVWEGESGGTPFNRLDDEVIANAFEVV